MGLKLVIATLHKSCWSHRSW